MSTLLRQPDMDFEVDHPTDLTTDWMDADDVPMSLREIGIVACQQT